MTGNSPKKRNDASAATEPTTASLIQTMAKAEGFVEMLRDGPKNKPELADELAVSKSTVYNWASELIEYDAVRRTDVGYELTPFGEQLAHLYRYTNDVATHLYDAKPLLQALPKDDHPPFRVLAAAEVVDASDHPYAPFETLVDWVKDADHVTGIPAVVSTEKLEALATRFRSNDMTADVVMETTDVELMKSHAPKTFEALLETGELYETDREIPIRLYVAEDLSPSVGVATLTDDGHVCTFAQLFGDEAVDWALELYEENRSGAKRIENSR